MQKAKLADAPASTSAKTIKSTTKPRKKGSPLDEIRNDPWMLENVLKHKSCLDPQIKRLRLDRFYSNLY